MSSIQKTQTPSTWPSILSKTEQRIATSRIPLAALSRRSELSLLQAETHLSLRLKSMIRTFRLVCTALKSSFSQSGSKQLPSIALILSQFWRIEGLTNQFRFRSTMTFRDHWRYTRMRRSILRCSLSITLKARWCLETQVFKRILICRLTQMGIRALKEEPFRQIRAKECSKAKLMSPIS